VALTAEQLAALRSAVWLELVLASRDLEGREHGGDDPCDRTIRFTLFVVQMEANRRINGAKIIQFPFAL
jgi:hypothetical protein